MNNSAIATELSKGKTVISQTYGDSMEPLLYNESTLVVVKPVTDTLKNGELPLYQRPTGQFVMHRIIKQDSDNYYTRGDNRTGLEKVPREWVLGYVTEITRKGRNIRTIDKSYRFYVVFLRVTYPIRFCLMKAKRLLKKIRK